MLAGKRILLIIGGGIAGLSAAAELAPLGSVLVLEAEEHLAHHASGRSAALYEPQYGLPPVVSLSMAGGDYFRAAPNVLSPRGLMIVGRAEEAGQLAEDAETMHLERISTEAAALARILAGQAGIAGNAGQQIGVWQ